MSSYTFTPEDVDPLLEGLAIMGTGGGGSPDWGKAIMVHDFARGRSPQIVSLDDTRDDATVVSGGIMGSVKRLAEIGTAAVMAHWEEQFELESVTRVTRGIRGRPTDHMVLFEVGGLNTPVVLFLGACMGFPIIDGDALGRSAPETQMTSFIGHGVSLTPMPLIDYIQPNVPIDNVIALFEAAHRNGSYPVPGRNAVL